MIVRRTTLPMLLLAALALVGGIMAALLLSPSAGAIDATKPVACGAKATDASGDGNGSALAPGNPSPNRPYADIVEGFLQQRGSEVTVNILVNDLVLPATPPAQTFWDAYFTVGGKEYNFYAISGAQTETGTTVFRYTVAGGPTLVTQGKQYPGPKGGFQIVVPASVGLTAGSVVTKVSFDSYDGSPNDFVPDYDLLFDDPQPTLPSLTVASCTGGAGSTTAATSTAGTTTSGTTTSGTTTADGTTTGPTTTTGTTTGGAGTTTGTGTTGQTTGPAGTTGTTTGAGGGQTTTTGGTAPPSGSKPPTSPTKGVGVLRINFSRQGGPAKRFKGKKVFVLKVRTTGGRLTGLRAALRLKSARGRLVGSGVLASLDGKGQITLKLKRAIAKGTYFLAVTGKDRGGRRGSVTALLKFK